MNGLNYERVILSAGPVGYKYVFKKFFFKILCLISSIMQSCLDYVLPYL